MLTPPITLWKPEEDRLLRKLWADGMPTAQIGDFMGRGKNSICSRARKLELPMRRKPALRRDRAWMKACKIAEAMA